MYRSTPSMLLQTDELAAFNQGQQYTNIEPKMEATEPKMETIEPKMEATEPKMEAIEPKMEAIEPGQDIFPVILPPKRVIPGLVTDESLFYTSSFTSTVNGRGSRFREPFTQKSTMRSRSASPSPSAVEVIVYDNTNKSKNVAELVEFAYNRSVVTSGSLRRPNGGSNSIAGGSVTARAHANSIFRRPSMIPTRRKTVPIDISEISTQSPLTTPLPLTRDRRRRSRRVHDEDDVLVGTKVSEGHQNYVTAYNMLTGIRVSVSRCNAKVKSLLTDADFRESHKLAFDISGNELTPSARYDFKFKDYAPKVFRDLREHFRLDPADYLMSLTAKYIVSELGSPGKSGSFFYYSRDYRFIIKTVHHGEHRMLRHILKDYYHHVKQYPNTLISQFYGLHRLELPFGHKIHFIIMNNLFPPDKLIHRTYDLKGSFLGRLAVPERTLVLKDLNWLKNQEKIQLGPIKRIAFLTQIEHDIRLLERLNLMDYSLLIGICDLTLGGTGPRGLSVFEPKPKLEPLPSPLMATTLPPRARGDSVIRPHSPTQSLAMSHESTPRQLRYAINTTNPVPLKLDKPPEDSGGGGGGSGTGPASGNSGMDKPPGGDNRTSFIFYHDLGGFQATDEFNALIPEIYYFGIIDCLTNYTWVKRLETGWKRLETKVNRGKAQFYKRATKMGIVLPEEMRAEKLISAVPAREYSERFLKFIKSQTKPK